MTTPIEKNSLAITDTPRTDEAVEKETEPTVEKRVEKATNTTLTTDAAAQAAAPKKVMMVSVAVQTDPVEKKVAPTGVEGHLKAVTDVKQSLSKAVRRMSPLKLAAFTALDTVLNFVKANRTDNLLCHVIEAKETKTLLCDIIDKKIP